MDDYIVNVSSLSMSKEEGVSKTQKKRRKQAGKRKPSRSPDIDSGSHKLTERNTRSTSATGVNINENSVVGAYQLSDDYVRSVMNFSTSPVMNFGQQLPYGFQTPEATQPPPVLPINLVQPPPQPTWEITLLEDVKSIK